MKRSSKAGKGPDLEQTIVSPIADGRQKEDSGGFRALMRRVLGVSDSVEQEDLEEVGSGSESAEDRYESLVEIARGGMGIVFQAWDNCLDRQSALKVAKPLMASNPVLSERFVSEAQLTAQLEHPNIIPVHDLGKTGDGGLYYTMKLVKGEPLNLVIDRILAGDDDACQTYNRYQRLQIFRKVCEAIAHAHSQQIIHLDIKPANIMVGAFGEVLVMDWGLARKVGEDAICDEAPGSPVGTPTYMSPEQAEGRREDFDCQTDVFLLGATLYHLMSLRRPYRGGSIEDKIDMAAKGLFMHPAHAAPEQQLPEELCRIIINAMEPVKENRYGSVSELLADLDDFMAGRSLTETRVFKSGEHLMVTGDEGDEGYVILRGKVEVYLEKDNKRVVLAQLGPGEIVGEMAVLGSSLRSASVVALEETEVEVVTAEVMQAEMRKLAPWMGKAVSTLAQRFSRSNAQLQDVMLSQELDS